MLNLTVEVGREADGRWFAEVLELPGVITYGSTRAEAMLNARTLGIRWSPTGSSTANGRSER